MALFATDLPDVSKLNDVTRQPSISYLDRSGALIAVRGSQYAPPVDLDKLPVITFGSADTLEVGDVVLAIGNPFGVGQTVTSGIVSALGRNQLGINTFENFIQTDAAINPGNSGGALVDVNGHLMGINTAIYSRSGGSMGIGFAIPVSTAKLVLEGIVKDGVVTRGWIGVEPADLSPELLETFGIKASKGVLITGVLQNGPASAGGLRPGDVVVKVGDADVTNTSQLLTAVAALKPREVTTIRVQRGDKALELKVTVAQRPKAPPRQVQPERALPRAAPRRLPSRASSDRRSFRRQGLSCRAAF